MRPFYRSLRFRIVLSVIIPVIITVGILSWSHYVREQHILESQIITTTTQLGEITLRSLHHAMLTGNVNMASQILDDVGNMENIERIQLLDRDGKVILDSLGQTIGKRIPKDEQGCIDCHQLQAGKMPSAIKLAGARHTLRVETTLREAPECSDCAQDTSPILAVLLMDVTTNAMQKQLRDDSIVGSVWLFIGILVISVGVYLFMDWFVVRRVEAIRRPLIEIAGGNLNARIPLKDEIDDEISDLANAFNDMAERLQRNVRRQEDLSNVRQQAIIEERERIARELHDGFAQIPVYVNTKASAVRLMLENGQLELAKSHLSQLQDAANELLIEVREAVISLKLSAQLGAGLQNSVQSYVEQLNRISGLQVDLHLSQELDRLTLDSETELQLFRIVQEALTNVRKHSEASHAVVSLQITGRSLVITVSDNGKGFDQERTRPRGSGGFGIKNMSERASMIQAIIKMERLPEGGTRITVTKNMDLE